MSEFNAFFLAASYYLWSYVIVGLCLVSGIYFTIRLGFLQFRSVAHAITLLRGKYEDVSADGITTFQALSTALSSTTGIGNIAGVAVAITTGGPGAIFWMWMMALVGMALKFVEATLGSLYREKISDSGEMGGGPMVYIHRGLGERWRSVAIFYSVCTAVACLGAWNMFQSNQAAAILNEQFSVPTWATGLLLSVATALVLIGGIKRIGYVASRLVPSMCAVYLIGTTLICVLNIEKLPSVMALIISSAFHFESAGGGVLGTAILVGIRRAVFSNEAGTGSAAIAHAAAYTSQPVRQGIAASLGPFIDTVMVCAATAFVILLSGFYGTETYHNYSGAVASFESAGQGNIDNIQPDATDLQWQYQSTEVPDNSQTLQRLTAGVVVLAYHSNSPTMLKEVSIPLAGLIIDGDTGEGNNFDALRFSAHIAADDFRVQLTDGSNRILVELPIGIVRTAVNDSTTGFGASISSVHRLEQWNAFLVQPNDKLKALIVDSASHGLHLKFIASGIGDVYLDRIETVSRRSGIVLSSAAFACFFGFLGNVFLPVAALFFAYTTVIAGNYYGEVACRNLSDKLVKPYLWLYVLATFIGCVVNLDVVINFSDLTLGLMTIPNIIAMVILFPQVSRETKKYFAALRAGEFDRP